MAVFRGFVSEFRGRVPWLCFRVPWPSSVAEFRGRFRGGFRVRSWDRGIMESHIYIFKGNPALGAVEEGLESE